MQVLSDLVLQLTIYRILCKLCGQVLPEVLGYGGILKGGEGVREKEGGRKGERGERKGGREEGRERGSEDGREGGIEGE